MANESKTLKPVAAAVGLALATSLAMSPAVMADNPFATTDLDAGYQLAGEKGKEGKCGEGKCGSDKGKEGACGEKDKHAEGKCGEGKCGSDKSEAAHGEKGKEGACGEKGKEGACGEGHKKDKEGACGGSL
jgi:uncharacterized low-complexity protein